MADYDWGAENLYSGHGRRVEPGLAGKSRFAAALLTSPARGVQYRRELVLLDLQDGSHAGVELPRLRQQRLVDPYVGRGQKHHRHKVWRWAAERAERLNNI